MGKRKVPAAKEWEPVEVSIAGAVHKGRFATDTSGGMTVEYAGYSKYALLHSSIAQDLARIILRELVREHPDGTD